MMIKKLMGPMGLMRLIRLMGLMGLIGFMGLQPLMAQDAAQDEPKPIIVKGNVYGGGNKGKVDGNTTVTVVSGDLHMVFGGARMADVGGRSFVNIDGENTTEYIMANQVYGGNDISGTIGEGSVETTVPAELTAVKRTDADANNPKKNEIDNTWKSFVRVSGNNEDIVSATATTSTKHAVYIGALFGGGDGEYEYTDENGDPLKDENGHYYVNKVKKEYNTSTQQQVITRTKIATRETPFNLPTLRKTYLEINGGSIVYAFGGGNNATVTEATVINVDNPTKVVSSIKAVSYTHLTLPTKA